MTMAIKIAGREVLKGDRLYNILFDSWGYVKRYDASGSAELELISSDGTKRTMLVRSGGLVNGKKQVYWHEPIRLDLPFDETEKLQSILDLTVNALVDIWKDCNGQQDTENV